MSAHYKSRASILSRRGQPRNDCHPVVLQAFNQYKVNEQLPNRFQHVSPFHDKLEATITPPISATYQQSYLSCRFRVGSSIADRQPTAPLTESRNIQNPSQSTQVTVSGSLGKSHHPLLWYLAGTNKILEAYLNQYHFNVDTTISPTILSNFVSLIG